MQGIAEPAFADHHTIAVDGVGLARKTAAVSREDGGKFCQRVYAQGKDPEDVAFGVTNRRHGKHGWCCGGDHAVRSHNRNVGPYGLGHQCFACEGAFKVRRRIFSDQVCATHIGIAHGCHAAAVGRDDEKAKITIVGELFGQVSADKCKGVGIQQRLGLCLAREGLCGAQKRGLLGYIADLGDVAQFPAPGLGARAIDRGLQALANLILCHPR